ncbi:MAG: PorV/PorQ family protein [Ignavibacteriaceae bacterium]
MPTYIKVSLLFLLVLSTAKLNAQYQSALPMLYLNPSPRLNGLGMVGTSLPNDDPFGFYYNPAQLGHYSQTNNLSYQLYPSNVDWLGFNLITYRNSAVNIGYNFKKELNGLSLSAGFGYIHSKLDYGPFIDTGDRYDEFNAYSLGIGIDYYVQFNIGITYKNIYSFLGSQPVMGTTQTKNIESNPTAVDYGLLLTVPVVKLIDPEYKFYMFQNLPAVPYFNISVGYSRLNQGGEVVYLDPAQADPLPRTARLGYTLSTGLDLKLQNNLFRVFGYDFTVDADEILINPPNGLTPFTYKNGIGDINIGKNLIELKGDDNVVVHKGHEFNFLETFTYMIGRFDGRGYYNDQSSGIGIRAKGILTLLKAYTSSETLNFIAGHFDIQYYSTRLYFGDSLETKYASINLSFYGFEF